MALSIERKIIRTFGDPLKISENIYYAFPTSRELATATYEQIRRCGLNQEKSEYIIGISKLIKEGKLYLEELKNQNALKEIIHKLDKYEKYVSGRLNSR